MSKRGRTESVAPTKARKRPSVQQYMSAARHGFSGSSSTPAVAGMRRTALAGTETKSMDTPLVTGAANSTTAAIGILNNVQEGASFYQRVGRRIRMKSIQVRASIYPNTAATGKAVPSQCRIMLIYDRQPNGAYPALADVLTSYATGGGTTSTVWDGLNMNNRDRFTVLRDNFVQLPAVGAAGASPASNVLSYTASNDHGDTTSQGLVNWTWYVKLKGLEAHYKASTGAIGDLASGSLFMLAVGDDGGAAAGFTLGYSARLKFYD